MIKKISNEKGMAMTDQDQSREDTHDRMQEKIIARNLGAMMKRLDDECKLFQDMCRNGSHGEAEDSAAFGLNRLEYQAAKVVAIVSVKEAFARGQIGAGDIRNQIHRSTRRIAEDPSFREWVKEASGAPDRLEKLGRTTPEWVKTSFIKHLSKEMSWEKHAKREGTTVTIRFPREGESKA